MLVGRFVVHIFTAGLSTELHELIWTADIRLQKLAEKADLTLTEPIPVAHATKIGINSWFCLFCDR